MVGKKKCVLYVYKGHLGLPSVDYKCLQALFLIQMKLKHAVEVKTSGFYTTPHFPMLEYDGQYYTAQMNILKKLEELLDEVDKMNNVQKSRVEAYKSLTCKILEPCIVFKVFGNDKNCEHTIKLYGSEKYFPMRLIYLRRMNKYVETMIAHHSQNGDTNVYESFESYLTDISQLLAMNKYLMGNAPCTLDAYVCGYLLPLYALNLPNNTLRAMMMRHDVVIKYLINYLKYYHIKIAQEAAAVTVQDPEDNDRASTGLIAAAGFVALSLMMGYGYFYGIFKFK